MTTREDTIRPQLFAILGRHLRLVTDAGDLSSAASLADLGLDSMAAVGLLVELEGAFGVTFPDEMLTAETFQSASTLERAIATLMEGA